jgi:hypothetical protein
MFFACMPDVWQQIPESNQNRSSPDLTVIASMPENPDSAFSDSYETKQPLTITTSPNPISDPIGAVLDYFGLLYDYADPDDQTKQIKTGQNPTIQVTHNQFDNIQESYLLTERTQTTQDTSTQDMTAPGVCTADEHQIQVGAETVDLIQANVAKPKIQYFSSDLYETYDPTSVERLPDFCDAIKTADQVMYRESMYSLYGFDDGPPCASEEC